MSRPPAVLLLHYFGGSARSWDWLTASLGPAWHCLAPDLPGFGDNQAAGPATLADAARQAETYTTGLGDFILVGHSMGGKIATALAARHPPGLQSLVLVTPSPPCPEPMTDADRAALRASYADPEAARRIARAISIRANDHPTMDNPIFARIVDDHHRATRAAWNAWLDTGSREDITPLAAAVDVPILVVAGDQDTALGPDTQRRLTLPHFPLAHLEIARGSRHLVPLDAPDQLASLIAAFSSK